MNLKYFIILGLVLFFKSEIASIKLWKCDNEDVIEFSKLCNGEINCSDHSDETSSQCKNYVCDTRLHQCSYGACVKNATECMRIMEKENSKRVSVSSSCKLNKIPANGFVQYLYAPGVYLKVNESVPNLVKVQFSCIDNYRISGNDTIVCRDGTWNGDVPKCEPFCLAIPPSIAFSTACRSNDAIVNCTEPVNPGTVATVRCKYGYNSVKAEQQTTCGKDGKWKPKPSPCKQVCGQWTSGTSHFPWHVTIYKRNDTSHPLMPICGGTILSAKVVVSAAQCFWNETKADVNDLSLYRIKIGKSVEKYENDSVKELISVRSAEKSVGFFGLKNGYRYDIVILILDEYIEFNAYTAPVCMDYKSDDEEQYVSPGLKGLMSIWNDAKDLSDQQSNETLNLIESTAILREQCIDNAPPDFLEFLTTDKFCTERSSQGIPVCQSDSGSGLVFRNEIHGETRYFLRGVASIRPSNGTCDRNQYATFSNVAYSSGDIKFSNIKYRPIGAITNTVSVISKAVLGACKLNEIPGNGFVCHLGEDTSTLIAKGACRLEPQDVTNYETIQYFCNENYTVMGKPVNICLNGMWTQATPKCVANSAASTTKQWKCDDGSLIDLAKVCDGESDCSDSTDETPIKCKNYICDHEQYQCSYGACVKSETDCRLILKDDHVKPGYCTITRIPQNGFVQLSDSPDVRLKVNEMLPNLTRVQFTCAEKYRIVSNDTLSCQNGIWNGDVPICEPFCPAIAYSYKFSVNCYLNGVYYDNCTEPSKPGTIAKFNCEYGYEQLNPTLPTICGPDGQWTPEATPCTQKCGELIEDRSIIGAVERSTTYLPWHVTLYKRSNDEQPWQQYCSGTILNARMVIAAAQCFWNEETLSFTEYDFPIEIRTGKSSKEYGSGVFENDVQYFDFTKSVNLRGFNGFAGGQKHDIFILILSGNIEFNRYTLPICIDYELEDEQLYVAPGLKGLVGGWCRDDSCNESSSTLQTFELSTITRVQCKSESTAEFRKFITDDKFCAGTQSSKVALSQSDSGSSLAFPREINGTTKYYLRGIGSFGTPNDTYNSNQYFTFVNVAHSNRHIRKRDVEYGSVQLLKHPDSLGVEAVPQGCIIYRIPNKGFISDLRSHHERDLGYVAYNNRSYQYSCEDNYTLKGDRTNVCLDNVWINAVPECIPFSTGLNTDCRALPTPQNGHIQYYTSDGFLLGKNKGEKFYASGTSAKINCLTGFEVSGGAQQTLTCEEMGNWSPDLRDVTCRPICGKQESTGTAYVVGGEETDITYAPWHVGIFKVDKKKISYHCGGTILTDRIVISAMHCFWDRHLNSAYNANLFRVVAGKQYSSFNTTMEPYKVQHFEITDLNFYSDYRDLSGNFALDIVLLLLNETIDFQHHVAPICVQLHMLSIYDIPVQAELTGTLAGWGLTESGGKISDRLKIVDLPTIDKDTCIADSPDGFKDFVTVDKFCAGHLNLDISACQGDSGGGLVFPEMVRGSKRFFLRGIVSVGANSQGSCDSSKYTTFTNVIYHDKFIRTALVNP